VIAENAEILDAESAETQSGSGCTEGFAMSGPRLARDGLRDTAIVSIVDKGQNAYECGVAGSMAGPYGPAPLMACLRSQRFLR
jgi:hypothetical protein